MNKIQADFAIVINDNYRVVEVVGRTTIYTPAAASSPKEGSGIKWYQDTYKKEYRG